MKKRRKQWLILLSVILLVTVAGFGTMAYFTDNDAALNVFTFGKVELELDEAAVNKYGQPIDGEERRVENKYHLIPGSTYKKDPTVHVIKGSNDCYVRVLLTITKANEWAAICDDHSELSALHEGNKLNLFKNAQIFQGYDAETWILKENRSGANLAGPETNTYTYEFWYKEVVEEAKNQNEDLPALFTSLHMPGVLTKQDMQSLGDAFKVYVVAQAIQADGFQNAEEAFKNAPEINGTALIPQKRP